MYARIDGARIAGRSQAVGATILGSPQQIAGWLNVTHPEGPEMQVSHESICRSLYAQSRWALPKELTRSIRTGPVT